MKKFSAVLLLIGFVLTTLALAAAPKATLKDLSNVSRMVSTRDGFIAASGEAGELVVFGFATPAKRYFLDSKVTALTFTPDDEALVIGFEDGSVEIRKTKEIEKVFKKYKSSSNEVSKVLAVDVSNLLGKNQQLLAVAYENGKVAVYNILGPNTKPVSEFTTFGETKALAFSRDGKKIFALTEQGVVTYTVKGEEDGILEIGNIVAFYKDGQNGFVVATEDEVMYVALKEQPEVVTSNEISGVKTVAISAYPKNERVLFVAGEKKMAFYLVPLAEANWRELWSLTWEADNVYLNVLSAVVESFVQVKTATFKDRVPEFRFVIGTGEEIVKMAFQPGQYKTEVTGQKETVDTFKLNMEKTLGGRVSLVKLLTNPQVIDFATGLVGLKETVSVSGYERTLSMPTVKVLDIIDYQGMSNVVENFRKLKATWEGTKLFVLDGTTLKLFDLTSKDIEVKKPVVQLFDTVEDFAIARIDGKAHLVVTDGEEVLVLTADSFEEEFENPFTVKTRFVAPAAVNSVDVLRNGSDWLVLAYLDNGQIYAKSLVTGKVQILGKPEDVTAMKVIYSAVDTKKDYEPFVVSLVGGKLVFWKLFTDELINEVQIGVLNTALSDILAVSPNGAYIAVATNEYIRVYTFRSLYDKNMRPYTSFSISEVTSMAFTGDSEKLIVGKADGTVSVIKISDGTTTNIEAHEGKVLFVLGAGDKIITVGEDGFIKIW